MIKRLFLALILTILLMFTTQAIYSKEIQLDKNNLKETEIKTEGVNVKEINDKPLLQTSDELTSIIDKQRTEDLKDLEILWRATVENNQVIAFSLKKMAINEEQSHINSSIMARTLSSLVTGASFVPSLIGANAAIQTSAFSAGRLAQGLINKKTVPEQTSRLSDTELIELAHIIEKLQEELIASYYNYKKTLVQLKSTRAKVILYSQNYSDAMANSDELEKMLADYMYNNTKIEEQTLEAEAQKYLIQLQRLAGNNALEKIKLYQYNFDTVLYKQMENTSEK